MTSPSAVKVRGTLGIADVFNGGLGDEFTLRENAIQKLIKNCPETLPLNLNHEDGWVVGYGKLSAEDGGKELVFDGVIDCGYFLTALQESKDSYYCNASLYRLNNRLKETLEEYLAIQLGQLSLCHSDPDLVPKHVGLVHLGQRIGSQGFFSSSQEPLKWRQKNKLIVNKMLSLAYVQRHLASVRSEKLLKDSEYVGSVGVLVNASHKGTQLVDASHARQQSSDTLIAMSDTIKMLEQLLRVAKEQQQSEQQQSEQPAQEDSTRPAIKRPPNDPENEEPVAKEAKLEKRVGNLESILGSMLGHCEQQTDKSQEQTESDHQRETAAATLEQKQSPSVKQPSVEQQQQINDSKLTAIVNILDRLSDNVVKLQRQQDVSGSYNNKRQQPASMVSKTTPSMPPTSHLSGIAAVTETQRKIAAESKLVNANFATPSVSNSSAMKLAKCLPKDNPMTSQLLNSFAKKVANLPADKKEELRKIMDFKE